MLCYHDTQSPKDGTLGTSVPFICLSEMVGTIIDDL
jgi:hypothetical protein